PVTHREFASSFALVTGHGREEKGTDFLNWKALATGIDTIAFYMGVGNLENICKKLIEFGKPSDTPVAIIENGTTIDQRTITGTLQTIYIRAMEEKITNPAMIIVGNVVKVREKASWYEDLIEQTK